MRRLLPLVALCAAISTACDDDEGGHRGAVVTVAADQDLRVRADEYRFDPSRVNLEDARREPVKIVLRNDGSLAHNLRVFRGERQLGGTPTFPRGETRPGTVRLPPGRYRMVCTVGNHEELGMTGELAVRD